MTFDYLRRPARVPASHINVSVLDPALSDLVKAPFDQSHADAPEHNSRKIHLPTGGPRFRPALEDVLEMAITEFNIDKHPSARAAIQHGRARFRARQLQTVVADDPETARTRLGELSEGHDPKPARLNAF